MARWMTSGALGVLLAATLVPAAPLLAEDASVAERLKARGLTYEVDGDGDFKMIYNYESEGRTQLVFVSGSTEEVNGLTIREVFSPAARVEQHRIDGAKALELLNKSGQTKLGAWEIRGDVVYFVVKVFDDLSAAQLEAVMDIAAETADDMEIQLTGGADEL
ncbi:MAG: YbjN domain-containing protein [Erythrobacter sp.]